MMGAVSEYFRRSARERTARGQAQAVARGATPWARVPLGYTRDRGVLSPDPETAPLVQRAFQMRAERVPISRIRAMLKSHGIERSFRGMQVMLASRIYPGEVHFGELANLEAHEPIIDRDRFEQVQRIFVARGRQGKSDRPLARLGVLSRSVRLLLSASARRTFLRSVSGWIPRSAATCAIGRSPSNAKRTPRSINSVGYLLGRAIPEDSPFSRTNPRNRAPAKPGVAHRCEARNSRAQHQRAGSLAARGRPHCTGLGAAESG